MTLAVTATAPAQTLAGRAQVPPGAVNLTDSRAARSFDCVGQSVVLAGSGSAFILTGRCDMVNVTGSDNTIVLAEARVVQFVGNNNHLTWTKRPRYTFTGARTSGNTAGPAH